MVYLLLNPQCEIILFLKKTLPAPQFVFVTFMLKIHCLPGTRQKKK